MRVERAAHPGKRPRRRRRADLPAQYADALHSGQHRVLAHHAQLRHQRQPRGQRDQRECQQQHAEDDGQVALCCDARVVDPADVAKPVLPVRSRRIAPDLAPVAQHVQARARELGEGQRRDGVMHPRQPRGGPGDQRGGAPGKHGSPKHPRREGPAPDRRRDARPIGPDGEIGLLAKADLSSDQEQPGGEGEKGEERDVRQDGDDEGIHLRASAQHRCPGPRQAPPAAG